MAEGIQRWLGGDRYDVFSAGTKATSVNPFAIRVRDRSGHPQPILEDLRAVHRPAV
ncbi:hypothetical protein [Candidatus Roseilinea sp. NK_OTU-006]|uniref:hypothetical protein n=1 Tax=Candidatus Roseilinea sp. NK_OTU-006 TaxID=2704250 RepID=UPI002A5AAD5A|nr:hypothetical protein [Candidatus Roseilinea sp. NK_OTU-006]